MKGIIQSDHIPVNKYTLIVAGIVVQIIPTEISGVEEELESVTLPDRTVATGGNTKASETTIKVPMHHTAEIVAMEIWFQEGQNPVSPLYKKSAVLIMRSLTGNSLRTRSWIGVHVSKRTDPDLEMENEGDMAVIEYELKINSVIPG